jgi:hypothetical protein
LWKECTILVFGSVPFTEAYSTLDYWRPIFAKKNFFYIVFYSGIDASHSEIWFLYTVIIIPAAPQDTVDEAGIEPGTAALLFGSPSCLSQLSHHIPMQRKCFVFFLQCDSGGMSFRCISYTTNCQPLWDGRTQNGRISMRYCLGLLLNTPNGTSSYTARMPVASNLLSAPNLFFMLALKRLPVMTKMTCSSIKGAHVLPHPFNGIDKKEHIWGSFQRCQPELSAPISSFWQLAEK